MPVVWSTMLDVVGEQGGGARRRRGRRSRRRCGPRSRSRRSVARGATALRLERRDAAAARLRPSARRSGRAPRRRDRRRTAPQRVTRPSAPKTQSSRSCRSKAPPPARSVPKFVQRTRSASARRPRTSSTRVATSSASSSSVRERPQKRLGSAQDPEPDGAVIDELDGGRERRGAAIEVERSQHRRDRARRRRGAGALGAVGEQLGVALVQPDDGVAEAVGRRRPRTAVVAPARRPRSE